MDEQNLPQTQQGTTDLATQSNQTGAASKGGQTLVDETLMNTTIDENVQQMINDPQDDPTGLDEEDKALMETIVKLIDNQTIDVHTPETLMNKEVYDGLDETTQGKVDTYAVSVLNDLKQIKLLHDAGKQNSFQIQNLVHRLRLTKERLEKECGDVYII